MADMLIRKIDPKLKREIERRAREHGRSLSDEAEAMLYEAAEMARPPQKLGTYLFSLLPDEHRGDDLVFDRNDVVSPPPNFE
ncbi:MAG: FitA-like ribbon-helix-helix domain-containing protein [Pseudorhodoplanes sp.]